jgi:hypothetical protein
MTIVTIKLIVLTKLGIREKYLQNALIATTTPDMQVEMSEGEMESLANYVTT